MERLAADVQCSLKTIRNDLKQLGSFLEEHGLGRIVSKSNKGVCLMKGKDWDAAKQAWNDENQADLYGTDINFQILKILLKQRSIQKMRLEQRHLISRLDAEKATSQASVWLAAHHVAVTCKRWQGLQIECSEYYWRMALWELFTDISRKRHEFGDQTLKSQTEKFLWGFDMAGVAGAIAGLEKEFGIHYSFDGYQQLSFLLSLCVLRIRKKEYAEIPADFEHQGAEWQGAEYDRSMAGVCMESLKKYYNIVFSPATNSMDEMIGEELGALGGALVTGVFLIFIVMGIQFESPKYSLMVMVTIPFSLIGSFGLLYLTGSPISMVSMLGFLMLVGTVVNNGILYVDTVNQMLVSVPLMEALVEAGAIRMRPILMTTLTTVISMIPNALAYGRAGKMMQGLALVNIGGLMASMVLTLILLPTFYKVVYQLGRKRIGGEGEPSYD